MCTHLNVANSVKTGSVHCLPSEGMDTLKSIKLGCCWEKGRGRDSHPRLLWMAVGCQVEAPTSSSRAAVLSLPDGA